MLSDKDTAFIEDVNQRLQRGRTWQQIADELGMPLSTLHAKVRSRGYKVRKQLVPIHVPNLEQPVN